MSSFKLKLREFLKRIKCFVVRCGSQLTIENSQIDGKPKTE